MLKIIATRWHIGKLKCTEFGVCPFRRSLTRTALHRSDLHRTRGAILCRVSSARYCQLQYKGTPNAALSASRHFSRAPSTELMTSLVHGYRFCIVANLSSTFRYCCSTIITSFGACTRATD